MSYYLTDPYHYLPKCYPFLNTNWQPYQSQRLTNYGQKVQEFSAMSRLLTSHLIHKEEQKCGIALLRCKYKMEAQGFNQEKCQMMASVEGSRKAKENNLRKNSHSIPKSIVSFEVK